MPGVFRCDRGDYTRVLFYTAREAAGAAGARHSLRPLIFSGWDVQAKLARNARRDREAVFDENERAKPSHVIARFDQATPYSRDDGIERPRRTGSPGQAVRRQPVLEKRSDKVRLPTAASVRSLPPRAQGPA